MNSFLKRRDAEFGETKPGKDVSTMDAKERKRHDRFNGLSEEEVSRKTLPDHITPNLDILMVRLHLNKIFQAKC